MTFRETNALKGLKLVTVAMLIPLGWHMSEAFALPQPMEQHSFEQEHAMVRGCREVQTGNSFLGTLGGLNVDVSSAVLEPETQQNDHKFGACGMNLNLIGLDSQKPAH